MIGVEPETGDWFVVPQRDIRVSDEYPDHVSHRWIVARRPYAGEVNVVLRTTTQTYSTVVHAAHDTTHEATCQLNRLGYLCLDRPDVHPVRFFSADRWSCREPDDGVLETVMASTGRPPRRPKTRRSERL